MGKDPRLEEESPTKGTDMRILGTLTRLIMLLALVATGAMMTQSNPPLTVRLAECQEHRNLDRFELQLRCEGSWSGNTGGASVATPLSGLARGGRLCH